MSHQANSIRVDWRKGSPWDLERALAETKLPERPDYERVNGFLVGAGRKTVAQG